jgi:hypothetical protein
LHYVEGGLRAPASDKKSGGVTSLCNAPTSFLRATHAPTAHRGKLVGKRASGYYVVDVDALAINRSTPKPVATELSACRSGIRNSSSSSVRMISLYLRMSITWVWGRRTESSGACRASRRPPTRWTCQAPLSNEIARQIHVKFAGPSPQDLAGISLSIRKDCISLPTPKVLPDS